MNSLNERVATYVRSQAGAKGYSTHSLAQAADLPVSSVRRYFWTGEAGVPLAAVAAIADVFGLSLSEFLARAEATDPEPFIEPRTRNGGTQDLRTTARGFTGHKRSLKVKGPVSPVDQ